MAPNPNGVSTSSSGAQAVNTTSSSIQPSPNLSRRTSSGMGPPPVPQNSSLPNSPRPMATSTDNGAFVASQGPIRHPRPLTAAELHLELEKEQESIVNRLTRELSALRAQTASVASTTSSTSDLFTSTTTDPYLYPYTAPNIIPTTARRHRSSSNLSSRSARSTRDALSNATAGATSVSSVAAPRDRDHNPTSYSLSHSHSHSHQTSSRPSMDLPRPDISRQNSITGTASFRTSTTTAPTATSPHWTSHGSHSSVHPRHSVSTPTTHPPSGGEVYTRSPSTSVSAAQAQARYEEAALQRAEMDAVKKENESLKSKIRELEKLLAEKSAAKAGD